MISRQPNVLLDEDLMYIFVLVDASSEDYHNGTLTFRETLVHVSTSQAQDNHMDIE